jgi:hypothetical protein
MHLKHHPVLRFLLLRLLPALLLLLFVLGVWGYRRAVQRFKGPSVAMCQLPPLARKSFEPPHQLSSATTPGALLYDVEPAAALLPDGALAVAFNARARFFSGDSSLIVGRMEPDGRATLHPYPTDRRHTFDAWMSDGPDGKARLVWLGHDGGAPERNMKVGYAETRDGLTWTTPPGTAHAPADCPEGTRGCIDKTMVAAGPGGIYSIYYSEPGEGLMVARSELGAPHFAASVKAPLGAYGDVFLAPSGALHLVAVSGEDHVESRYGDPAMRVLYTRSDDGGKTFSPPSLVSEGQPVPFYFSNPQVTMDEARGFLYVAWPSGTPDGRWDIYLGTSRDQGKTWTRIKVNDDATCATHMTPQTALDPRTGALHVTWLDNRDGGGALAYAACEPGGARCSANEAVSDKPFASYSFERHLPAWLSEYGVLLVDAERRLLHAFWTQPVDEDGRPTSRIFHARKRLP